MPRAAFRWLEEQSFRGDADARTPWIRPARWGGRQALQLTSYAGIVQAADGTRIEVLPKVARAVGGGEAEARWLLVAMLRCLPGFRHVRAGRAEQLALRMPLPEVFIAEFLGSVRELVKRGLRGDYRQREGDLYALCGKLLVNEQLRRNSMCPDRFFTAHDEFSSDRAENRLLHAALRRVLAQSSTRENQQLARELAFVFGDVPPSPVPATDFAVLRRDRGMTNYADALAWARLILGGWSPVPSSGAHAAPSLLFPMEALFEAYVTRHLPAQLPAPLRLATQVRGEHLATHRQRPWFRLQPDLLLKEGQMVRMVLDTKWKLLDTRPGSTLNKYGLSEADFYQLHAYGHAYLNGAGELALVYPMTDAFQAPLEFSFRHSPDLRLWALPFCMKAARLHLPDVLESRLAG
ncbi:McrC family protein [Dokdonella sp.]|uniref:McrC family protein n=1 Tax=Dokdonella sp. TaxID=2291710 RepID=UPI003BAF0DA7